MQRLRVRFARRGRLRFTSHRDFQRAFERALRRARVPVAYSQGFSPHPKVSYAGAVPTGAASEAEYLDLSVTRTCEPSAVAAALDEALPPGLDVLTVVEAGPESLADLLQASEWDVRLPAVDPAALRLAVARFLEQTSVEVERMTKSGVRTLDARAAVVRLEAGEDEPVLRAVVRHVTPTVRPEDMLRGLRQVGDLPEAAHQSTRLGQGPLDEASGTVSDPLVPSGRA